MKFKNIMLYSKEKSVKKMLDARADLILLSGKELEEFRNGRLEVLDVFNEANKRIRAASRKACIRLGLITRAVHIFVFNSEGEVFLQKRSESKDTYPGFYAPSASGHVDLGEEAGNAALRELQEELNISPRVKYLGVFKCFKPENAVNQFYYFFMAVSNEEINTNKEEIQDGKWFSLKQLSLELNNGKFVPAIKHEINLFSKKMIEELEQNKIKLLT